MHRLEGTVALVTGASRGVGRGIAEELGAAGATVYVTGRSVRGEGATESRFQARSMRARHPRRRRRHRGPLRPSTPTSRLSSRASAPSGFTDVDGRRIPPFELPDPA